MRLFLALGAVSGFLSVALGAFAAHALRARLEPRPLEIFETAVRYQMYHAIALLAVAVLLGHGTLPIAHLRNAGWAFVIGTLIFSGSLYALALTGISWLGAITPIGGVSFLVGWGYLVLAAWRSAR